MSQPGNVLFSIPPTPQGPWIDVKTGIPTREFYRFIYNLFVLLGRGQAPIDLLTFEKMVLSNRPPSTSAIEKNIADLWTLFNTGQTESARIDALDRRLSALESTVYGGQAGRGIIDDLRRGLADTQTIQLTGRK